MPRKILTILSIIIIIFLLILGGLFLITRTPASEDESGFTKKVREIFPFGKPSRDPDELFPGEELVTEQPTITTTTTTSKIPRLRKIHNRPTSGSTLWITKNESTKEEQVSIRFVDRATGHVFETNKDSATTTKISNTTLPKIYEATFFGQDSFVARFLDNKDKEIIKTYIVNLRDVSLPQSTTTASTTIRTNTVKESVGLSFDDNIKEIATSPQNKQVLYSLYTDDEKGALVVANTNNTNKRKIYESPLREWLLSWQSGDQSTISTKPSGYTVGFAYTLNTNTGALSKIVGNVFGLTIKPITENTYLVGRGGYDISLFNFKTNEKTNPLFLANTLPEKCVASKKETFIIYCAIPTIIPNGVYPDYWYQGRISFIDTIWKINTNTASTNLVSIPERDGGESVDVIDIQISADDSYLTFINKKDLSLWGLILKESPKNNINTTTTTTPISTSTKQTN